MWIRGARIVRPRTARVEEGDLLIHEGRVVALGGRIRPPPMARTVEASGLWIVPGWIDLQVNDVAWIAAGPKEPEEHAARIRQLLAHQARGGVTGLVLATMAAPDAEVVGYLRGMRRVLMERRHALDAVLLGALVEGTFMNPDLHGAHNPAWVRVPDRKLADRLVDTGAVRLFNVAPEMSRRAVELVRHLTSRGIVVGVGHSKAHAERLREAVDAGLRYVIHLGNGPTGSSLKVFHDGGLLEEGLRNDRLAITLILDGVHVHPRLARDWIARKEVSRVIGISDAAFGAGAPPARFEAFGVRGELAQDGRYLQVAAQVGCGPSRGRMRARLAPSRGEGIRGAPRAVPELTSDAAALFGSAVGMREVFENALCLLTRELEGVYHRHHPAMPLDEAMIAASRIASTNAADLLALGTRGSIERGGKADLVLVELRGKPGSWRVKVRGTWIG